MSSIDDSNLIVQQELMDAGSYIRTQADTISGELSSLVSTLTAIEPEWTGAASYDYFGLQQEWNIAANGLLGDDGVLGQIAAAMNIIWNNYADAETANVSSWQSSQA
jgi:WXG100 family type VII secretion target